MRLLAVMSACALVALTACGEHSEDELFDTDDSELISDRIIFANKLNRRWEDWSWGTSRDFTNSTPVFSGPASIKVEMTEPFGSLYLRNPYGLNLAYYTHLEFRVRQKPLRRHFVALVDKQSKPYRMVNLDDVGGQPSTSGWTTYRIPLSALAAAGKTAYGLYLQTDAIVPATDLPGEFRTT